MAPDYLLSIYADQCVWKRNRPQYAGSHTGIRDLQAVNTEAQPENVVPVKAGAECSKLEGGKLEAVFAKHSWNMIRLAK